MRSRFPADRRREAGTVTAEFATVVPAVLLVLLCCLGTMHLASRQLLLQDAASDAARLLARGEPAAAAARVHTLGASFGVQLRSGMVCASLRMPAAVAGGMLSRVTLTATGCALGQ